MLGEATGEGNKTECPTSTCATSADRWMADAAATTGRSGIPVCELGVEVVDTKKSLDGGVFVRDSFLGAADAGLTPGDIVIGIGTTRTRTAEDLDTALMGAAHGSTLDVQFVRKGAIRNTRVRVSTHADDRPEITGPVIGIHFEPVGNVPHVETRVMKVSSDDTTPRMLVGDVIERMGNEGSPRAIEIARAVGANDARARSFIVRRKGRPLTIKIGP